MKYSIKTTMAASIALIACFVHAGHSAPAQTYTLTDLGALPKQDGATIPAAINDQGQVTGTSGKSAFRYSSIDKGPLEYLGKNQSANSRGFGINDAGQVVGDSTFGVNTSISPVAIESSTHAAIFDGGSVADLGTLKEVGDYSRANGINASGQVVGFSGPTLDSSDSRAFIWSASTGMLDLGTLGGAYAQAFAINDSGFVTGNSQTADSQLEASHAFIYQPLSATNLPIKGMRDLGTLGGNSSYGTFINANNHVVGYSTMSHFDSRVHAFLYDGAKMLDLGSLGGKELESDQSVALGINTADQVVGYSYLPIDQAVYSSIVASITAPRKVAFISSKGVMVNLNERIGTEANNYWLYSATAINNKGQIVAEALDYSTKAVHAVLLTPMAPDAVINAVTITSANHDARTRVLTIGATVTGESSSAFTTPIVQAYYLKGDLIGTLDRLRDGTYIGKFTVATKPQTITVSSSLGGSAEADVTDLAASIAPPPGGDQANVNRPQPAPIGTVINTVTITSANHDARTRVLTIGATVTGESSSAFTKAIVQAYLKGDLIGTLDRFRDGTYIGKFTVATKPQTITVSSSLGGSAEADVTDLASSIAPPPGGDQPNVNRPKSAKR